MPKGYPKPKPIEGKRVNVYLTPRTLKTAKEIENLSKFVQLALLIAPDLMAWAILKEQDPTTYYSVKHSKKLVKDYNKKYPLDPITKKRLGLHGTNTQRSDTAGDQETNPVLR